MSLLKKNFLMLFLAALLAGCSLASTKATQEKQKAEIELKKKNYNSLREAIRTRALAKGTRTAEIEKTYGAPDDVFHSGSVESTFEVWTYEAVMEKKEDEGVPLRLYFNNGKLVNWNY